MPLRQPSFPEQTVTGLSVPSQQGGAANARLPPSDAQRERGHTTSPGALAQTFPPTQNGYAGQTSGVHRTLNSTSVFAASSSATDYFFGTGNQFDTVADGVWGASGSGDTGLAQTRPWNYNGTGFGPESSTPARLPQDPSAAITGTDSTRRVGVQAANVMEKSSF